jgi:hypothetical protein
MAGRASFEQISEPDYSNLLQALSASTKGRRFLDEYRRRSRPDEALGLLTSLKRMEATIATVRDQLQPERIAEELLRVAMTLEIALDGAGADPEGSDSSRRFALVDRARLELASLARGLAERADSSPEAGPAEPQQQIELTADQGAFLRELGLADYQLRPER